MKCPQCDFDNSDAPIICAGCDCQFSAGGAVSGASEWRPIETAPRDGTEILATDGENRFITAYLPSQCSGFGSIHSCCGYYKDLEPTHWMRLPEMPKEHVA